MPEQRPQITTIEVCPLPPHLFGDMADGRGEVVWAGLSRRAHLHFRRLASIQIAAESLRRQEIAECALQLLNLVSNSNECSRLLNSPQFGLWIQAAVFILDRATPASTLRKIVGSADITDCDTFLKRLAHSCQQDLAQSPCLTVSNHSPTATTWLPGLRDPVDWLDEATPLFAATHQAAWKRVQQSLPWLFEEALRNPVITVAHRLKGGRLVSTTFSEMLGCIYLTSHPDASLVGEQIVHEYCHTRLFATQALDDLLHETWPNESWDHPVFYSPWRQDPRPINGVLHGCYVFTNIARYWLGQLQSCEHAAGRLGLVTEQLRLGFRTLKTHARWTACGMEFFRHLSGLGNALLEEARDALDAKRTPALDIEDLHSQNRTTCFAHTAHHAARWRAQHPHLQF
jgi:hypothetical protein